MKTLDVSIKLLSPLHIGSGKGIQRLLDMGALKYGNGMPYIAGSSFKGRLRATIERFLSTEEILSAILAEDSSFRRPCLTLREYKNEKTVALKMCGPGEENKCFICKLFGSSWHKGQAIFTDLKTDDIQEKCAEDLFAVRSSNKVDRQYKTSYENMLFNYEIVDKRLKFKGQIILLSDFDALELRIIETGVKLISHLGGKKSSGLGRCEVSIFEAKIGEGMHESGGEKIG